MAEPRPFRAVVADDEPAGRDVMTTFLADEPRLEVVGVAANGDEAVELVRRLAPDLLFLDIQMPDRDGFGVLEVLGDDVPAGVVFVTAHDEHALRAFEVHALDYVLKPFGRPRFQAAVERALRRLAAEDALSMRTTLRSMMEGRRLEETDAAPIAVDPAGAGRAGAPPSRIGVRHGTRTILVDVDAIEWVEAAGDYARIHVGDRTHVVSERMHALEEMLEGASFLRIHRSLIVSLSRVRELRRDPDGGGSVILESGVRLRVARNRWSELQRALGLEAS